MGFFELFLLAVGLAMDAFAVSIGKGMSQKKITVKESLICGIWFGVFQSLMPLIGYLAGARFERLIGLVAPWMAFLLLSIIGGNMIREAFSLEEDVKPGFDFKTMFILSVATSIDALAVGITFVAVPVKVLNTGSFQNVLFSVILIGIVTFIISMLGVRLGNLFGARYKSGSEIMGGTILIFIGLHSLIEHLDKSHTLADTDIIFGMLIPLIGTVLGAASVYAGKSLSDNVRMIFNGSSAGIMFSVAVWGMIEPAIRGLNSGGRKGIIPVFIAFGLGIGFQYLLDTVVPHTHAYAEITEGPKSKLKAEVKMMLTEIIHHIPEGIALGAIYAGHFMETKWILASMAVVLAIAIAIQNFPEALFVALPIREKGNEAGPSFFMGIISGAPVPLLGIFTVIVTVLFPNALPYIMAFAGGAMIYTTVEEIPQIGTKQDNDKGSIAFAVCFALVMLMIFL